MLRIPRVSIAAALALLVAACGDSGSTEPPPQVGVSVTPGSASLDQGATTTFSASVSNATNAGVTWTTTGGQLSAQGNSATLTAPASAGSVTVTATSVQDPARSASATVTVAEVGVSIVAPETAAVRLGQLDLSASVTGTVSTGVTWTTGCPGFQAEGASATWTAPGTVTTCEVTATSAADASKSATVELSVRPEFFVNATDDAADGSCNPAHCSLREAITLALAEVAGGADSAQVRFATSLSGATITLAAALPDLDRTLSIVGPGMASLTLDANGGTAAGRRHFRVLGGARVSVEGMTLTGGSASGPGAALQTAGSIWVSGASHLRLRDVAVTGNRADALAGGIRVEGGSSARIEASRISENSAGTSGGAFLFFGGAEVVMLDSEVLDNVAAVVGGGAFVSDASMEIYDSRIDGNTSTSSGGGMSVQSGSTLYMEGGSISGNRSQNGPGGGVSASTGSTLSMTGVMLGENHAQTSGGALHVWTSTLHLNESELIGNTTSTNAGGAVYLQLATAEMTDVLFRENISAAAAGALGIYFESEARLTNVDFIGNRTAEVGNHLGGAFAVGSSSTLEYVGGKVHDNEAAGLGGGFSVGFADAHVSGVDVAGNHAGTFGGGIAQQGPGTFVLEASTVRDNEAGLGGGGLTLQATATPLLVRNVTVSGNRSANGSALRMGALGRLENVTMVGNVAAPSDPALGGAIFALGNTTGFEFTNVLLAGNLTGGERRNCTIAPGPSPTVNSLGGNLSDDDSCAAWLSGSGTPDLNETEAGVDMDLADNGGSTLTHALVGGSAALGAGNPDTCPATDQRGFARGSTCDVGAFQLDGVAPSGVVRNLRPTGLNAVRIRR